MSDQEREKSVTVNVVAELPDELNVEFEEFHCTNCGRFLCLQAIVEGTLVIKCRQCKQFNILDVHGIEVIKSEREVDQDLDH